MLFTMKVFLVQNNWASVTVGFVVVDSHTRVSVNLKSQTKVFFFSQHNSYTFSNPSLQIHKSYSMNLKSRNSYACRFCYYCSSEYGAKHIHTPASKMWSHGRILYMRKSVCEISSEIRDIALVILSSYSLWILSSATSRVYFGAIVTVITSAGKLLSEVN